VWGLQVGCGSSNETCGILAPTKFNLCCVCSVPDVHYKYYMVVSPLDGRLYITDQQNLRIIRVKTMGAVRAITDNYELVAGNGRQCIPGDVDQCGDGAAATEARLFYPKGINGVLRGMPVGHDIPSLFESQENKKIILLCISDFMHGIRFFYHENQQKMM